MTAPLRLLTLAPSHYSEKARWALDLTGLPYRERCMAPGLHYRALKAVGSRSVPTVLFPDGSMLKDSTDILKHLHQQRPDLGLWPQDPARAAEVDALEEELDEQLASRVRDWMYSWGMYQRGLARKLFDRRLPLHHRVYLAAVAPSLPRLIRRRFKLDRIPAGEHLARLQEIWSRMDARLADGRRYLTGDSFTAADLTLAAMGGQVIGVEGYGGQTVPLADRPPEARATSEQFAASPAGRLITRLYREHRGVVR
ncbi:MAG: glutathione S-transferase family protein [Myxococcota bacterium]|nr:glutathione S-transferase family protein [Myxococcota bacterium]